MPKDTKTLGNNKARAWESLGFVHKKRLGQRFDTTSINLNTAFLEKLFDNMNVSQPIFHASITGISS